MAPSLRSFLLQALQRTACLWLGCGHLHRAKMTGSNTTQVGMGEHGLSPMRASQEPWPRPHGQAPGIGSLGLCPHPRLLTGLSQMPAAQMSVPATRAPYRSLCCSTKEQFEPEPWVQPSGPQGLRCQPTPWAPRLTSSAHGSLFPAGLSEYMTYIYVCGQCTRNTGMPVCLLYVMKVMVRHQEEHLVSRTTVHSLFNLQESCEISVTVIIISLLQMRKLRQRQLTIRKRQSWTSNPGCPVPGPIFLTSTGVDEARVYCTHKGRGGP